jgi:hypothetical protein
MATRPAGAVADALEAKGMDRDETHHHMYRKTVDGVTRLVTRMSHNSHEINDDLAKRMANQLCLQLGEFWRLVDCPLTEEEWDALVADRCTDGRNPFLGR